MLNDGPIMEIIDNETVIKNAFGFGAQVFGYPTAFNSVTTFSIHTRICSLEVSRQSIVTPKISTSVWDLRQTL